MEQKRSHVRIDDYIFFEFSLLEKDEYSTLGQLFDLTILLYECFLPLQLLKFS